MPQDAGISRRYAILALGAAAGATVLGCRSARRRNPERDVERVSDAVEELMRSEPTLPGIVSAEAVTLAAFGGRSEDDARVLAGRLYYEAVEHVSAVSDSTDSAGSRYSRANVRRALAQPVPAERFGRSYFDGLLRDTRARMQDDLVFARQITNYSSQVAARERCRCTINGEDAACWKCLIVIVVIIVIILV